MFPSDASLIMRRSLEGRKEAPVNTAALVKMDSCGGQDTPQEMRVLYDYNAWANHARGMRLQRFRRKSLFRRWAQLCSVRDTLAILYGAEWIWLERFQGRSPSSLPDTTQFKNMAELRER